MRRGRYKWTSSWDEVAKEKQYFTKEIIENSDVGHPNTFSKAEASFVTT